jgi:hypothetical protein
LTTGVILSESDPDRLVLIWSLGFKFRTSHGSPRINSQGDRSELAQDACSSVGRVKERDRDAAPAPLVRSDTDGDNRPMAKVFRNVGYRQFATRRELKVSLTT